MEKNLTKFDLFNSMMNRLGVNPSELTLDWLQHRDLSFVCLFEESSKKRKQAIAGKVTLAKIHLGNKVERTKPVETPAEKSNPETVSAHETSEEEQPTAEAPVSEKTLFYEQDWEQLDDKFELNNRTFPQLRCGMFAYKHGSKIVITKKTLSSQKVRNQNYNLLGIVFDLQENLLLTLKFCAFKSNHAKALKRMSLENRFPLGEECEKIFIYQDILNQAFRKMNIDFQKTEKIFYTDPQCAKGHINLFNFKSGETSSHAVDTAIADAYMIQVIEF